ncbi:unnamed protein product [Closterium sp. NIES-65]|nr:unnamed protein product [Closterium sp. NIES-65]
MATGATSAVLTVQQLSARAARIMRSTPWGRLMRPDVRLPHVQAFTGFLEASHRSLLQSIGIPSSAIFHRWERGGEGRGRRGTLQPISPLGGAAVAAMERMSDILRNLISLCDLCASACFPPPPFPFTLPSLSPLSYTYLMNSFAAQLTTAEARRLKRHPAVAEVERDRTVRVTSVHSPEFLKLDSSLWPANGGQSNAGEGVIIGVIDSGIWPEHPSFSDPVSSPSDCVGVGYGFESAWQSNAGEGVIIGVIDSVRWRGVCSETDDSSSFPLYFFLQDPNGVPYSAAPVRWRGVCTKTDDFTACNGKVVGCYRRCRGAAGNAGVEVTTGGRTFGTASGMAPRARLAVYKALWIIGEYQGIGSGSDLIAAAEKAVADGVDVISCSWGGLAMYFQDLPYLRGLKHFQPAWETAVPGVVDVISCSWGGLAMCFQDLPYLRGLKVRIIFENSPK